MNSSSPMITTSRTLARSLPRGGVNSPTLIVTTLGIPAGVLSQRYRIAATLTELQELVVDVLTKPVPTLVVLDDEDIILNLGEVARHLELDLRVAPSVTLNVKTDELTKVRSAIRRAMLMHLPVISPEEVAAAFALSEVDDD